MRARSEQWVDRWTEERVQLLLRLNAEDVLSRAGIARELSDKTGDLFTHASVTSKLARLGVPLKEAGTRAWTEQQVVLLVELNAEKTMSASEIAKEMERRTGFEFSRNAICGKLFRLGIQNKPFKPRKLRVRKAAAYPSIRILEDQGVARTAKPEPLVAFNSLNLTLMDLGPDDCRYPTSGDNDPVRFCGHPISNRSFCAAHYQISYYTPRAPRPDASHRIRLINARKYRASLLKPTCEAA